MNLLGNAHLWYGSLVVSGPGKRAAPGLETNANFAVQICGWLKEKSGSGAMELGFGGERCQSGRLEGTKKA